MDARKLLGGFSELAQALAAAPDEDTRLRWRWTPPWIW
jgi:hypothetical protein